jgi:hypothetical protein
MQRHVALMRHGSATERSQQAAGGAGVASDKKPSYRRKSLTLFFRQHGIQGLAATSALQHFSPWNEGVQYLVELASGQCDPLP